MKRRIRMLSTACLLTAGVLLLGVGLAQASAAPSASTGGAPEVEFHSAKVTGTIHPEGTKLEACFFEYGPGLTTACSEPTLTAINQDIEGGSTEIAVATTLTGLEPETFYNYQLVIEAEGLRIPSENAEGFTTPSLATVATEGASPVGPASATFNGQITPEVNGQVAYHFTYGKSPGELSTPTADFTGTAGVPQSVTPAPITGLEAHTEYHVQLVAEVEGHTIVGNEVTFTTESAKPVVLSSSIQGAPARTTATISSEINLENEETAYAIQYEAAGVPTRTTQLAHVAPQAGPATVSQTLEELRPATLYSYHLLATNEGGTAAGAEGTFMTAPAQPASVVSESAQTTSQTTALLTAMVDPNGLPTSYALEIGTEVQAGVPLYSTQSFGQVSEGSEPQKLELSLTNLLPGTTYHYRIVATNEEGPASGADVTFATPGFASPIVEPPHPQIIPVPPPEKQPTPRTVETRAQKLAKALKQCTKEPKKKRASCRKKAEKQFGPVKAPNNKKK